MDVRLERIADWRRPAMARDHGFLGRKSIEVAAFIGIALLGGAFGILGGYVWGGRMVHAQMGELRAVCRDLEDRRDHGQLLTGEVVAASVGAHSDLCISAIRADDVSVYYGPFAAYQMTIRGGPGGPSIVPQPEATTSRSADGSSR